MWLLPVAGKLLTEVWWCTRFFSMCVVVMQGEGLGVDEGPAGPACHRTPPVRLAGLHRPHPAVRGADRWGSLPHLLDDVAADTMGGGGSGFDPRG